MPRYTSSRSPSISRGSGRNLGYSSPPATTAKSTSSSSSSRRAPSLMGAIVNVTSRINNINNGNSNVINPIKQRRRKIIERIAVVLMLLIGWSWIMVVFGMVFYHGYQYRLSNHGLGTGDARSASSSSSSVAAIGGVAAVDPQRRIQQDDASSSIADPLDTNAFELRSQASPLVIFTCQRAQYLRETLDDVFRTIPNDCSIGCPIYISQDGADADVAAVIDEYTTKFSSSDHQIPVIHLRHKSALRRGSKSINSYQALALHYGWALGQIFASTSTAVERLIILEEDIHTSVDFFQYMGAMARYLESDTSLLAVSAFNDNGYENTVSDNTRVLRSDFFPGLGWMLTKKLWDTELKEKWPTGYWDDWLREPLQRQGRHILRPEISRTFHFGTKGGASNNQFGGHLTKIQLNTILTDWDISSSSIVAGDSFQAHWSEYLRTEASYDSQYLQSIQAATLQTSIPNALTDLQSHDVRVEYKSFLEFKRLAKQLDLMDDEKAGIPRTSYKGVVETRRRHDDSESGYILFLTPPMSDLSSMFRTSASK